MKKIVFAAIIGLSGITSFAAVAGGNTHYKHPFKKVLHKSVHHSHHAMIPFDHYKI